MKNIILILLIGVFISSCTTSNNETPNNETPNNETPNGDQFNLVIDGVTFGLPTSQDVNYIINISKKADIIHVGVSNGDLFNTDSMLHLDLNFTKNGKFLSGNMSFNSYNFFNPSYTNFIEFPSNFFHCTLLELDEVNKRVKINFDGKLYENKNSITSDTREIKGELNMKYIDNGEQADPLVYNGIEQYCRANINSIPWFARFENNYSAFTNEDAYKIETHFDNSPTPGNFTFNSASTDNYVRFSKYNPLTLTYDYYNVSGQVGYTYREYHGYSYYSFIGTFSFTATNPNNSADNVQVTDGVFRSYQQF